MPRLHPISLALVCVLAAAARGDDGPPATLSPVSEERRAWAENIGRMLGLELQAVQAVQQPARPKTKERPARPAWRGLLVELEGLVIDCRRCADAETADLLFGSHVNPIEGARTVLELRGADVVVLRGRALDDPAEAVRALALAWTPREREGPRALGTIAPIETGRSVAFAGFSFQPSGSFYVAGSDVLRAARKNDHKREERAAAGISWRFLDGGARNHVVAYLPGDLVAEAELTPTTMLFSLGEGVAAQEREEAYLLALLRAANVTLPRPASGLVELIDPPPSRR